MLDHRIVIAQDVGSAINGANHFDMYLGTGLKSKKTWLFNIDGIYLMFLVHECIHESHASGSLAPKATDLRL